MFRRRSLNHQGYTKHLNNEVHRTQKRLEKTSQKEGRYKVKIIKKYSNLKNINLEIKFGKTF